MGKIRPNQKNYHQQFPAGKTHLVPSRKLYLDKTLKNNLKTFYGPGQPPDSGGVFEEYNTPDDWPPVGYLALRVPQIVWVTATFPQQFTPVFEQHTDGMTIRDWVLNDETFWFVEPPHRIGPLFGWDIGGNDSANGFWNNDGQHSWTWARTDNFLGVVDTASDTVPADKSKWVNKWDVSTDNQGYILYNNLLTTLANLKIQVESARKGYTWVNHLIWFNNDDPHNPENFFKNTPFDNISYTAFTCPDLDEYFGLDFLHIHLGNIAEQNNFNTLPEFTAFTYGVAQRQLSHMINVNQFRRFKIMIFDWQPDWTLYPPLVGTTTLSRVSRPSVPIMKYAADNISGSNDFKPANWVFADPQSDADRSALLTNFVNDFNSPHGTRGVANFNLTQPQIQNTGFIESAIPDLIFKNVEIEYMGTCDSITSDDLFNIIQEHYQWPPAHS